MRLVRLVVPVLALLVLSAAVVGQQPSPLGLNPIPVVEPLAAELWMDRGSYMEGESAQIVFSVNQPAYVYILNIQSDGIVRLVFPNAFSQQNFVSEGVHTLPNGLYQFTITPPAGTDHLQIIASLAPLQLAGDFASEPYAIIGQDPNVALAAIQAQIDGLAVEGTCAPQWTTDWCSFTIIAAPQPQQDPCDCAPPVYTPPAYTPPVSTPPTTTCPTYTCPTYAPPTYAPPTYTPPTCTVPTYTPPTCVVPYTVYTYTNPCAPVANPCLPTLFPFLGGSFRVSVRFRVNLGICCEQ